MEFVKVVPALSQQMAVLTADVAQLKAVTTLKHKVDNNPGAQFVSIVKKPTFHIATIVSYVALKITLQGVVGNPGVWETTNGYSKGDSCRGEKRSAPET